MLHPLLTNIISFILTNNISFIKRFLEKIEKKSDSRF